MFENKDAETLSKAFKGFGCDKKAIIKLITNRTMEQRLMIKTQYKQSYGEDLIKDLKSELSGNMEDACVALFTEPVEYDCQEIRKACKGAGTDEDTLIEIICSRDNKRLNEIKKKYQELYKITLEDQLRSELSGDLKRLLISVIQASRSENNYPNDTVCKAKAEELYKAGVGKLGTDEQTFNKIFCTSSRAELIKMAQFYNQMYKHNILEAVDKELSGDLKKAYKAIIYSLINPCEYFATRINKACKGLGTNDNMLIRILVTRDEIDMPAIKQFYKKLYNKDLIDEIKSECSGSYEDLLVELVSH